MVGGGGRGAVKFLLNTTNEAFLLIPSASHKQHEQNMAVLNLKNKK